jgi:hypothetical protein
MSMRALLAGFFALSFVQVASAQIILKREPHYLAPGSVVYVDTGQCGVGKVMKVTGISKGISRRKTCIAFDAQQATLKGVPSL